MNPRPAVFAAALAALSLAGGAHGQELLLHFPLDGSPAVVGSAAGDSRLYLFDGGPAPTTVPGKIGSALHFTGKAAIAMPLKLDAASYPRVTVTAWVRLDPDSRGDRTIFSAGNGNVPKLMVNVDRNNITAARGSLIATARMPRSEWVFVAGSIDVVAARLENVQGEAVLSREGINVGNLYPPSNYRNPDDPSLPAMPYVFVGSHGFGQWRASGMAIDDVRVYAGVLSQEQVAELRNEIETATEPAATVAQAQPEPTQAAPGTTNPFHNSTVGVDPDQRPPGPIDLTSGGDSPYYQGGALSEATAAELAARRAETAPPDITYASEQEALAAEERRKREAAEEELARQQNKIDSEGPTGPAPADRRVIGWRLSATDVAQTPTSGSAGDIVRVIDLRDEPLTGITIFEPNNVPCEVFLYVGDPARFADKFHECTPTLVPVIDMSVFNEAMIAPAAIESLRVCRSIMNNDRVKGIAVSGRTIEPDGSLGQYHQAQGDGPNCGDRWAGIVACEAGYVATGAIAHFKDRDLSESLVGLGLVCRRIEKIYE